MLVCCSVRYFTVTFVRPLRLSTENMANKCCIVLAVLGLMFLAAGMATAEEVKGT